MNQTTLAAFLLVLLLCNTHASSSFLSEMTQESVLDHAMNAAITSNGVVPLNFDKDGLYVEAETSLPENDHTPVKMMLALSMNDTVLAGDCFSMTNTFCPGNTCENKGTPTTIMDFPYFSAYVQSVKTRLYLDSDYWDLQAHGSFVSNCYISHGRSSFAINRAGVIGLGTKGSAKDNFRKSKAFTIYLNSDSSSISAGTLYFREELSQVSSSTPVVRLSSDPDWYTATSLTMVFGSHILSMAGNKIMFDVNYPKIGLPVYAYNSVMKELTSKYQVSDCIEGTCAFKKKLEDLPILKFHFGKDIVEIPPAIYASIDTKEKITLNFADVSTEGFFYSWNSIILFGAPFMKYYLTVFDGTPSGGNEIKLYKLKGNTYPSDPSSSNNNTIIILVGIGVVVLLMVGAYFKWASKRSVKAAPEGPNTSGNNGSTQVPYMPPTATTTYGQQSAFGMPQQPITYSQGYSQPQQTY